MSKLFRALADLFWPFSPLFFIVLVLALFGKVGELTSRSDLILGAAVLFAEGWWKIRSLPQLRYNRSFYEFLGFSGAVLSIFLATIMLLHEVGPISELARIIESRLFFIFQISLEITSLIYAFAIRLLLIVEKDWRDRIQNSRQARLEYLDNLFPEISFEYEVNEIYKTSPSLPKEEIREKLTQLRSK